MREDSGRPAGAVNNATSEFKFKLSELAREYTNDTLNTLVDVMQSSQSDPVRIAAVNAIFLTTQVMRKERAYTISAL